MKSILALLLLSFILPIQAYDLQQTIKPHLLPAEHPYKPALDAIFKRQRATYNDQALQRAGFSILIAKKRSHIRVIRHPLLPGHLIKANLDTECRLKQHQPAWLWLARRCQGVKQIQRIIDEKNIVHFQAPQKWLYTLPSTPSLPGRACHRQPVILLVEDMQLVPWEDNLDAWKNRVTKKHLQELYTIIRNAGGSSYRPDNIWLSANGKFSFIDTEYPYRPADYRRIRRYLSKENLAYWDKLVRQGGRSHK